LKSSTILKIFLTFFLVFNSSQIHSQSKEHRTDLKGKITKTLEEKKYFDSIPLLEEYTSIYPEEILYSIYLAKSYLYREDLVIQIPDFNAIQKIRSNYHKSLNLFTEKISALEQKTPHDKILGEYFFLLGTTEMLLGYDFRAISKFKKSITYEYEKRNCYYNIGMIYERLGFKKESDQSFQLYNQLDKLELEAGRNERKN
jgi:tetratricopeptide (TPR) repeat protein